MSGPLIFTTGQSIKMQETASSGLFARKIRISFASRNTTLRKKDYLQLQDFINFNGDTLRIFNNHLQSIHLNSQNYIFLDSLRLRYNEQQLDEIMDISHRLKDAFVKRSQQADMISEKISASPYPVIICGDFNDTPVSYTYKKIKTGLSDSFIEAGSGIGNTYSGITPALRIDYILHNPGMTALCTERVRLRLSDHYPLITYLKLE